VSKQSKKLTETFSIEDLSLADYTILSCACQYDIFENVEKGKNREDDLLAKIPRKILPSLLSALVAFGYLNKGKNSRYFLTPISKKYLIENSAKNILPLIGNAEWYWLLVTGPKSSRKKIKLHDETLKAIVDISYKIGEKVVVELKKDFPLLFKEPMEVLDLGCGKMGVFTKIAKQNRELRLTGVERNSYAVAYLREMKKKYFGNRLKIIKADVEKLKKLNGKFDFVLLSHIIHWVKENKVGRLVQFCQDHLRENGVLIIYEDFLSNDGLFPKESARKNLILSFLGFKVFRIDEIENILRQQRFSSISSKIIDGRRILIYARQ